MRGVIMMIKALTICQTVNILGILGILGIKYPGINPP
jgi:hypothetical protein